MMNYKIKRFKTLGENIYCAIQSTIVEKMNAIFFCNKIIRQKQWYHFEIIETLSDCYMFDNYINYTLENPSR